jgi:hypothetical protein
MVLHCIDRTYSNTYLITINVRPLLTLLLMHVHPHVHTCTHTHTRAPSILPLFEELMEDFFQNLPELDHQIWFGVLCVCEICPLRPICRVKPKSPGAKSGRVQWFGDDSVFLGEELLHNKLSSMRLNQLSHFLSNFFGFGCRSLPASLVILQCLLSILMLNYRYHLYSITLNLLQGWQHIWSKFSQYAGQTASLHRMANTPI